MKSNKKRCFVPVLAVLAACLCAGPVAAAQALPLVKATGVAHRYALGLMKNLEVAPTDEEIGAMVVAAAAGFKAPTCQVAFYKQGKEPEQGVLAVGETLDGKNVSILRPENEQQAKWLEKLLAYPTTPGQLSNAYLENQVMADDDFQGKPVVFEGQVADIAKGAFNLPYIFFPKQAGGDTGLTCYFAADAAHLRQIRKGSTVLVRGVVKDFLMQDVILEKCEIVSFK